MYQMRILICTLACSEWVRLLLRKLSMFMKTALAFSPSIVSILMGFSSQSLSLPMVDGFNLPVVPEGDCVYF